VSRYVDEHRGRFGVEPICKTLGVSVSAYYKRASGERSLRAVEDERLLGRIRELHAANYYAYGYRACPPPSPTRTTISRRPVPEVAVRGRGRPSGDTTAGTSSRRSQGPTPAYVIVVS
jgi:hypothetical protein